MFTVLGHSLILGAAQCSVYCTSCAARARCCAQTGQVMREVPKSTQLLEQAKPYRLKNSGAFSFESPAGPDGGNP